MSSFISRVQRFSIDVYPSVGSVLLLVVLWQLLFSLHHYDGDDRIKDFIFDLVSSTVDGQEKDYRNHTGTVLAS